jgi:cell division protein FtsZ
VINNEKLIEVYGDLTFTEAFGKANEVLNTATKGIAEVISQHLLVNIDLNDARKVLENSGTAVMGQAKAEGENRAIEAVTEALDSPLLNDNDITGAQQVLLKIVTGDGDGEIRMSELAKIKDKIQEAAGRNVNIIEGIGIDPELGAAVSVTVIATGFKQRKEPKGTIIVGLDDNELLEDCQTEEKNDDTVANLDFESVVSSNENNDPQHTLDLKDEECAEPTDDLISLEMHEVMDPIPQISEEKKIVFELNIDEEESAEQVITELLDEEHPEAELKTVALELDDEHEITQESETLQTMESSAVSTDTMKVEARERENRLRAISQQLRTPSGLTDLEDVPAYQRNNIELNEESHSSEDEMSTYTLSEGEKNTTELKQNNSFLHDNVD